MKRLHRLVLGSVLAGSMLAPFVASPPAISATAAAVVPTCSHIITESDSGQTIPMAIGTCDQLRLDSGLVWSQPTVSGTSVVVTPVPPPSTAVPPYQAWNIYAVSYGQSTVTSLGRPVCVAGQPCPQYVVLFQVKIDVFLPPTSGSTAAATSVGTASAATTIAPFCPQTFTNANNGTTVTMVVHTCAQLTLDNNLIWTTPQSSNPAVVQIFYPPVAPGTVPPQTWFLNALQTGETTITSIGHPACPPSQPYCPTYAVLFSMNIRVIAPPPTATS